MAKTQVNASETVCSSHKGAPDVSVPVHASSGPTTQMSQVSELSTIVCGPFYTKGHMTCHTCMCADIISDIIMSQNYVMS